jgi:predicted phage tail protein
LAEIKNKLELLIMIITCFIVIVICFNDQKFTFLFNLKSIKFELSFKNKQKSEFYKFQKISKSKQLIFQYEVEKMDLATGRWVPCGRADGNQTKLDVKGLQGGHQYQFRVRAVNKEGESDPLTTTDPTLAKNPFDSPDKMETPNVVDWDKDHVDLEWKEPANVSFMGFGNS